MAVDPYEVTRQAVADLAASHNGRWCALAVGKASRAMMRGAIDGLGVTGLAAGCVVAETDGNSLGPEVERLVGDHPVPGARSFAAAASVERWLLKLPADARVLVLLSGGTTSMLAAPVEGVTACDLVAAFEALLASGVDIRVMNAARKRLLRFGAGRLAVALAPRPIHVLIASDVLGNDPAVIASGPCAPDSLTAAKVLRMLEQAGASNVLPPAVAGYFDAVHHQRIPETPKPGSAVFRHVETQIIVSNREAVEAAVLAATRIGWHPVRTIGEALSGEARRVGTELASRLVAWSQRLATDGAAVGSCAATVAGGETTVTLGRAADGQGGRCQELALATARELHRLRPRSDGVTLLAAGTDGRDGPTDAAGAVVDAQTWSRIGAQGRDPERDLANHESHPALDAAGALLRTGLTGTNVNDLVVAVVRVSTASWRDRA